MKRLLWFKLVFFVVLTLLWSNEAVSAQDEPLSPKQLHFGYSKNPKTKIKTENTEVVPTTSSVSEIAKNQVEVETNQIETQNQPETESQPVQNAEFESRSAASKTLEIVKVANKTNVSPTEIYKIGVGDVLFVSLQNAPAKVSTYFTVLNNGTIDYPLAGEMVSVGGLTTEEVEDFLKEKIKLYENPNVSVKVREHASHSITVLGMVEKAGEKYLQREAIPLFVVRAEAVVQPKANTVVIKRANLKIENINLKDPKSEDVLIFPGDIVEFKSLELPTENSPAPQFYYIGGKINSAGQKDFHTGLTLTQAILASGGLKKQSVRKVVIRRKNQAGLLSPLEFDLNFIKGGKQPDPVLQAGDTIEVVN